ncbi:MAG: AAA family ATPase [Chloroflexi bacterium]|nr:AAA family ATPase [Chloroflexota bacterium]
MIDQRFLEDAIDTIRTHRAILGDAVVTTAVAVLQEKLHTLAAPPSSTQVAETHEMVAVLQADLSGFTAMSAEMDAEQVRDMVNALWDRLDNVVRAWGGSIDKHTGDGLIALFGAPTARQDDTERAVLAALDMQMEMALFNEATRSRPDTGPLEWRKANGELRMRIGIHAGPVVLAQVGTSKELTAVGETITIAEYLQQAAPVGRALVSYDVYRQVYGQFEVNTPELLHIPGRSDALAVYVVQKEKARAFQTNGRGRQEFKTRFIDRTAELDRLQFALQETMNNSIMQVITVVGETGVGKSRLFDEFERLMDLLPVRGCVLRAQARESTQDAPYALMRDLFTQLFEIHPRSSTAVSREKFVRGVEETMRAHQMSAREQAHVMGHFVGLDFADSPYLKNLLADPVKLSTYAHNDLARFFTDLVNNCPPVVWLVENAQWADAASLDLIEWLLARCADLPLLVVCLTRPELVVKRPSWQSNDPFNPITTLALPPLSAIDARHLLAHILEDVPNLPVKLLDLAAYGAQGNPLFAEQLARLFLDNGVIGWQKGHWQVNLSKLEEAPLPDSLAALFQARVACLSPVELTILQTAVLFGDQFWDGPVQMLVAAQGHPPQQVAGALDSLEQKDFIVRRHTSALPGVLEYQVAHDVLRQVAAAPIAADTRRAAQAQIVDWLTGRAAGMRLAFFHELLADLRRMMAEDFSAGGEIDD